MMYQGDAEILFPPRVIPSLRSLRGPDWQDLVDHVIQQPDESLEKTAFSLMMIRLDGCLTCHADSYRAMRGCSLCARQTISRFKGEDVELIALYNAACEDIQRWREQGIVPVSERLPTDSE